jgi:adenosylcobalamin-dependent ribonucleoside-diphosphate reductase
MSIFDLVKNEARVFKYGSGTGTNFSRLRGRMEKLSGGGTSSGLMSFLEVLDRGAGATKSGGTTRRAAKMVVLDMDHPEIVDFVHWKVREERKVAALVAGGYSSDFNGEAYATVSGQNSNNSVRVPDTFMDAVEKDGSWQTRFRTTGEVYETFPARKLWHDIAEAAWTCADPGVQYDDTIQKWHTCKGTDRINATNPCSEFVFLDDTACNLASINLMKFHREDGSFDIEGYRHANRVFFLAQEILVSFASYPTERIARNSEDYRPLGLGYANLGTLLMVEGLPYDSDAARSFAACITAIMTGEAYALSAEMAASKGPFRGYEKNRDSMLGVMRLHREAARAVDPALAPRDMRTAAIEAWDRAVAFGGLHGYRNSQATVLAPTGTIGLLMDCDTTGVEPDFALVKFKKLAGGGYFKIVNQSVPRALERLGYDTQEIDRIIRYAVGNGTLSGSPHINESSLHTKGLNEPELQGIEKSLPNVLDIRQAFGRGMLSDETLTRLGVTMAEREKPAFNVLPFLGFTDLQIEDANLYVCGTQTVEGAPGLKTEHLPVFDCANRCGARGTRFIQPMGHVRMMGAAAAVHLGCHQQDREPPQRGHGRGSRADLPPVVEAGPQGRGALPRRLQDVAAAGLQREEEDRGARGRHGRGRRARQAAPPPVAAAPSRLHAGGAHRRAQGVPAHRRVRGRRAGRDLHRHAQGGRGVPQHDELLRHRREHGPAVRRAARGPGGPVLLHAVRAARPRRGPRQHQGVHERDRLRVPRARLRVPEPHRPRARGGRDPDGPARAPSARQRDARGQGAPPHAHRARTAGGGHHACQARGDDRLAPGRRRRCRHGEPRLPEQEAAGRCSRLRLLRPHHDPQRHLLQVPELRQLDGCS